MSSRPFPRACNPFYDINTPCRNGLNEASCPGERQNGNCPVDTRKSASYTPAVKKRRLSA